MGLDLAFADQVLLVTTTGVKQQSPTRGQETTPLSRKGDIEVVSSELDNGDYNLHFLDETSKAIALSQLIKPTKTSSRFMTTIKCVKEKIT
ncbi:hypothetical protein TNCV_2888711 [Trichonephila clavipes]|nr:hypothetical protein TNCV_2888711 [Trichonephila clavipes]